MTECEDPDEAVEAPDFETLEEHFLSARRDHERQQARTVARILGVDRTATVSVIVPEYYGELLAWALHRYIGDGGWGTVNTIGYRSPRPMYIDVDTGDGQRVNVLRDGTIFLERDALRLAVTASISRNDLAQVIVTGPADVEEQVRSFAGGVESTARDHNFYRGRNVVFTRYLKFIDVPEISWEDIVLDDDAVNEAWSNTVAFLRNRERLARYGLPAKRGLLLVGKPGTGKTLLCKALMSDSAGITCLLAQTRNFHIDDYAVYLYEVAQDLAPCIVFIEDIDLIARDRIEWGYDGSSALETLLSVLDGMEETREIVTVATTNHLETLDRAIGARPSRFDRVIEVPCPSPEQRRMLVASLCRRIPLDERVQARIAARTEGFTPAQIQEVLYTLAIGFGQDGDDDGTPPLAVSVEQVDRAISGVRGGNRHPIGFPLGASRAEGTARGGIGVNGGNGKEARR
ncbi:MAG: ATP-binding protein [Chloroflexota bacterium]|nr:ATP-binding protein [Chloroflexota bacterium]